MAREWRELSNLEARLGMFGILWVALVMFCLICAIIFSCAQGVSKDKASVVADSEPYGAPCGAECGAACGA
ncbi:hypothetical protein K1719_023871 [Acacia pycnantha]|nr:hypothetical protein K1719_023871 [Acacia pycnantha]